MKLCFAWPEVRSHAVRRGQSIPASRGDRTVAGARQFSDWRAAGLAPDVPLYGAVVYRELYPGIDMVYGGEGGI